MAPTVPSTTAQLQYTSLGGPLKIVQVPTPNPGPSEVLIRQRVIALNPVDAKQRKMGLLISRWPHVLGVEGGGVIEAVGSEVHDLQPGDEVAGLEGSGANGTTWGGAFQERVVVPACYVGKKPKNISLVDFASMPIAFATAVSAIVCGLNIPLSFLKCISIEGQAPSSILVLGGSSVVGAAAIQLLRTAYPSLPILATSSAKHHAQLSDLGATYVGGYKSTSIVTDLKAASPGGVGVDVILDCVSAGASQTDICDVLDPAGSKRYAAIITGIPVVVPKGVEKVDASMSFVLELQGGKQIFSSLTKLVEDGTYKMPLPVKVIGHGLEELADVLDQVMAASGEKVIVTL